MKVILRLILIVMGVASLIFQFFNFIFSSLNRTSNDVRSRMITDTIPHFFTLVIIIWFLVYQVRRLMNNK